MKRILLTVAALAAISVVGVAGTGIAMSGGGDQESKDEASYTQAHRSEAKVSEEAARATAQGRHAGSVVDTHLQHAGQLVWAFVLADNSKSSDVQVDAGDRTSTRLTSSH